MNELSASTKALPELRHPPPARQVFQISYSKAELERRKPMIVTWQYVQTIRDKYISGGTIKQIEPTGEVTVEFTTRIVMTQKQACAFQKAIDQYTTGKSESFEWKPQS